MFNPKDMQKMMKQLGVAMKDIDAEEVVITLKDGSEILIKNPTIQEVTMKGDRSFQISGEVEEYTPEKDNTEDVKMVMEQTGVSDENARAALKEANGDIAEAIIKLKKIV